MQCTKLKTYMETGRVVFLPPSRIRPNPAQPRTVFSPEALEELAQSIRIHGILQPLSVRRMDTHYELIAGERRYRAAQMAGLREIPCIVMRMDDSESGLAALLENLQRQDLNFVEEARAYSQLMSRFSLSQEQVAKAVGKSQSAVANTLRLLRHSPPVLQKLLENGLTQRHARALLKLNDEPQKLSAISHITRNHLSVSQTEAYIETLLPKASLVQREVAGIFDSGRRDCNETTQTIPQSFCSAKSQPPLHKGALDASQMPASPFAVPGSCCARQSELASCRPLHTLRLPLTPPPAAGKLVAPGEAFLSQILGLIDQSNLPITVEQAETDTHTILTLQIPKAFPFGVLQSAANLPISMPAGGRHTTKNEGGTPKA